MVARLSEESVGRIWSRRMIEQVACRNNERGVAGTKPSYLHEPMVGQRSRGRNYGGLDAR